MLVNVEVGEDECILDCTKGVLVFLFLVIDRIVLLETAASSVFV